MQSVKKSVKAEKKCHGLGDVLNANVYQKLLQQMHSKYCKIIGQAASNFNAVKIHTPNHCFSAVPGR